MKIKHKLRFLKFFLLSCLIGLVGCATVTVPAGITPVSGFDAERYLGTWYEIARIDSRFERGLYNVTATYTENSDGSIKVENRGYKISDEKWKVAAGKAKFVGDSDVGHLKVSFFGPFYASYVVYELDEDYGHAFVTGQDKDFLWLLAREPKVSDEVMTQFKEQAAANGYDLDKVVFDVQRDELPR